MWGAWVKVRLQVKGGEWRVSNLAKNKRSESRGWRTGDLAPSGPLPLSVILGKYWLVSEVSSPGCLCDFFLLFNCSVTYNSVTPWTAALQVPLSSTISQSLFRFMFTESVILSHPLLPSSPFTLTLSQQQGLFQWISSLHQVDKVLEFQLQHQSFQ